MSWSSLVSWHKHTFQMMYASEKLKHYRLLLTLLLFVRWVWLSNTDEDDKKEERPEELDYQLDLWGQRRWALIKINKIFKNSWIFTPIFELNVSTLFLLRYVMFFQRRRRSCLKKSIASKSYLTMIVSWKQKYSVKKIKKGEQGYIPCSCCICIIVLFVWFFFQLRDIYHS